MPLSSYESLLLLDLRHRRNLRRVADGHGAGMRCIAALFLISSLVSVAALFVLSGAEFIAGVQILVYVGGVMVLFLFVIMLVNVGAEEVRT